MFEIKITKTTPNLLWKSIDKYINNYGFNNIMTHLNISEEQFNNIRQQMDTGDTENYKTFDDYYKNYYKEIMMSKNRSITKNQYKNAMFLLLAYYKNIIIF